MDIRLEFEKLAIHQLFRDLSLAWNNGDGMLYASYFTEDADYVTFDGIHLHGRTENSHFHNKLFSGILKGSRLVGEIKQIRFISEKIAIIHQTGVVQLRFQRKAPVGRSSINTNVLVREGDEWKISAFHNCRIRKPGIVRRFLLKFAR